MNYEIRKIVSTNELSSSFVIFMTRLRFRKHSKMISAREERQMSVKKMKSWSFS